MKGVKDITRRVKAIMCRVITTTLLYYKKLTVAMVTLKRFQGLVLQTISYQESALHGKFAPLQTSITKNVIG